MMWWRVPKRMLLLGSAVLLGRMAWASWARGGGRAGAASERPPPEDFPDTVPAVWSRFPADTFDDAAAARSRL